MNNPFIQIGFELFFNDDDDEEDVQGAIILDKVWNYTETTVSNYTDGQFKMHFRISPMVFEDVLTKLINMPHQDMHNGRGNPETLLEKQFMLSLWYLANIESFRGVSDRFGVSKSTAWLSLYKICKKLLVLNEIHKIIAMPTPNDCNATINTFQNKTGFPGIVGAVDGTHIPIIAPKVDGNSYINRKGFYSVLLQGVCNENKLFIDCYAGEVGSVHDACMFRRSEIGRGLENFEFPQDGHLLGDSAYPLKTKLLVPFKDNGHLTDIQKNYNRIHSKSRVIIEQTYGLLKGRFRRLKLLEAVRVDIIPLIIISCCILHNIAHAAHDFLEDIQLNDEMEQDRIMNPGDEYIEENNNPQAIAKRNNIANLLFLQM